MTGNSMTFRQEPKHDLTGAWFDAPLCAMSKARASGWCQTSRIPSSSLRNSENRHIPGAVEGRQWSIPHSAHSLYGKLVGKMKADKCGQISRQPLKRAFATSGPAFTSSCRWVNGQQQTWQVARDQSASHCDSINLCFPLLMRMPVLSHL